METDKEKLYSTAEIMLATGVGRGTITNRALKLGYVRDGQGYTAEQVFQILTIPLQNHRRSEEAAMELRETLNQMIEDSGIPMCFVQNKNGEWKMEHRKNNPPLLEQRERSTGG